MAGRLRFTKVNGRELESTSEAQAHLDMYLDHLIEVDIDYPQIRDTQNLDSQSEFVC